MKRGQLTIFVIIGIVLLVLIAMLLVITRTRVELEPVRTVPAEFEPLRQHVLECVQLIGSDAIKEVASHGGYLDPLHHDPAFLLDQSHPVESDLVLFNSADTSSAVPYYFYLQSPSTCSACSFSSLAPSKEQVENDIGTYIEEHLDNCINFGVYPDLTVEASPDRTISVTVTNESVTVLLDWIVRMQRGDSSATIEQFYKRIDIPLGRYLNTAYEIAESELYFQYLENFLLYIINTYGGIGRPLPGLSGFEESFTPSFWVRTNVERNFRQLLYALTPALKVIGAAGDNPVAPTGDPYLDNFLRLMRLPAVVNNNITNLSINFHYLDQPIYLKVSPSKGELIKPRSEKSEGVLFIPPRQMNYYDFFYDLSVPFIVEIRDPQHDVSFLFALEANLRDNKNFMQWVTGHGTIPWRTDLLDLEISVPQTGLGVTSGTGVTFSHNRSVSTPLCKVRKARFQARTWDAGVYVHGVPRPRRLENVSLSFRCGYLAECELGMTHRGNFFAEWNGKLPPCAGGLVKASKDGYLAATVEVSTLADDGSVRAHPSSYTFNLYPFVEKRVRFEKYLLDWRGRVKRGPLPLDDNDVVRVEFRRHQQQWGEDSYSVTVMSEQSDASPGSMDSSWETASRESSQAGVSNLFAVLPTQQDFANAEGQIDENGRLIQNVSLVPGTYDVSVQYYDKNGRTIPKHCQKYCYCPCWSCSVPSWAGGCDEKCVYIPENEPIEIEFAPWGGLEMNSNTRPWIVRPGELYADTELVIPVLVAEDVCCNGGEPTARCPDLESLERMDKNEEYTRQNHLFPHFVH